MSDEITSEDVTVEEAFLGYTIRVRGEVAGSIEGVPGQLDHIAVEGHWEDQGVARAAIREFIELSRCHGESTVATNNAVHPAAEHILETEGFEQQPDGSGWEKAIDDGGGE